MALKTMLIGGISLLPEEAIQSCQLKLVCVRSLGPVAARGRTGGAYMSPGAVRVGAPSPKFF